MNAKWKSIGVLLFAAVAGHFIAYYMFNIPTRLQAVILVTIVFFYPVLRNPLWGLYVVFIIAPLIPYIRRLYYLAYPRPEIDPLIALGDIFLAIMLMGLFFEFRERNNEDRDIRGIISLVFFYFAYMLLRVFLINHNPVSTSLLAFRFYGVPVLYFFIGVIYACQLSHMKRLWTITIVMGICGALYGIKQLHFGYSEAEHLWFSSTTFTTLFIQGIPRPFSFFQAPVSFADYSQMAILGLFMWACWSRVAWRYILLVFVPPLVYCILITSVRSSWVGMIASFVLWGVVLRVKGTRPRVILIVVAVILYVTYENVSDIAGSGIAAPRSAAAKAPPTAGSEYMELLITSRTGALTDPFQEHSFKSRLKLWQYIIYLSQEPVMALMGRGLGNLKADSLYVTYLAEFGYPGAFLIIAVFIVFIARGLKTVDTSKNRDIVVMACGITVMNIILAVISITGTHIHSFPGDLYFWFWNGVLIKLSTVHDMPEKEVTADENPGDI